MLLQLGRVKVPFPSFSGVVLMCAVSLLAACGGGGSSDGGGSTATAPTITAQPTAQSVTVGQSATFSVTAAGSTPLTYQWQRGGTAVSGATSASYTLTGAALTDSGASFTVVVTNSVSSVTSSAATLTVTATATAPTITTQPTAQTTTVGQSATFSVTAAGTAPLTYQWQRGGSAISGATSASYTLTGAALTDSGASFTVVVTNAAGSITSNAAALTVTAAATAPTITTQPTAQTTTVGQSATFSVTAAGTAPLTYQWQRGGSAISGATSASYTLTGAALTDSGASFTVVVTNAAGSVTSSAVSLTVTAAVTAPTITVQPQPVTANDGATATFTVNATGTAPLTYQWKSGVTNVGPNSSTYTTGALVLANNGALISVVITNAAGSVTSNTALLTVHANAPTITTQPTNQAGPFGGTATFTVVAAAGSAPLTYQWKKGGTNIAGATSASYTTPTLDETFVGLVYSVAVTDSAATVNSTNALLEVHGSLALEAGQLGGIGHADGTGANASFYSASATATDTAGDIFVADTNNNNIRKITSAGVVSTIAGTAGVTGFADGTGGNAQFNNPTGIAVDASGTNVYVADTNNDTIRKVVVSSGVVTTLAGSVGVGGSNDGTGAAANFAAPGGLALDSLGNLYVADTNNDTIRKVVVSTAVVTTLAGAHGSSGFVDGTGIAAKFNLPAAVAVDSAGTNVYVSDSQNSTIRKIVAATGVTSTLAGTHGTFGYADGTGGAAQFNAPEGIALDSTAAFLYVADAGNVVIRQVTTTSGVVTTVAGTAGQGGSTDGTGTAAQFSNPAGLATNSSGDIFVADAGNNLIREIVETTKVVSTFAGNIGGRGYLNNAWILAHFNDPHNIAMDASGNIYVADLGNNVIREIAAGGSVVTTFAGGPDPGQGNPGAPAPAGSANGAGAVASFDGPFGMVVDSHGNIFVSDSKNNTIRKMTPAGVVSTFAGTAGNIGSADGTGAAASFWEPLGLAIDPSDNLYVADYINEVIRKITPAGVVTTLAGTVSIIGSADGTAGNAEFNGPHGLAFNNTTGVLYIADRFNDTIRAMTITGGVGTVTTIAGTAGLDDFIDGTGFNAHFNWPGSLAVDQTTGNLYITDYNHNAVRKYTASTGAVTTIVGYPPGTSPAPVGAVLGALPGAISGPTSIVVIPTTPALELLIADDTENAVLLATP